MPKRIAVTWIDFFKCHGRFLANSSLETYAQKGAYLLQIKESLLHGVISSSAMAVCWLVALWNPRHKKVQA